MKSTINKSELMKKAWRIYRTENSSGYRRGHYEFRFALIRAWKEAKREAEMTNRTLNVTRNVETFGSDFNHAIANHYATAQRGTYFGD